MDETNRGKFPRRQFLKASMSTAAIGALGVLSLRDVLAQAKRVEKPLLTERNFNRLIPEDMSAFRQIAAEAKQDLKGFIKKRFYLVESQKRQLDALTSGEIQLVKNEIDKAIRGGYRIRLEFRKTSQPTTVQFVSVQQAIDPTAPKPCGGGTNANCGGPGGRLCACRSMGGNDFGGVVSYGGACDIAGGG